MIKLCYLWEIVSSCLNLENLKLKCQGGKGKSAQMLKCWCPHRCGKERYVHQGRELRFGTLNVSAFFEE